MKRRKHAPRKKAKPVKRKPRKRTIKRRGYVAKKRRPSKVTPRNRRGRKSGRNQNRKPPRRLPRKRPAKSRKKPSRAERKKTNLKRRIRRDKVRVFGQRRRRQPKEMPKAIVQPDVGEVAFEEQLQIEQEKPEGAFAWTNEDEFIQQMELLGFSEREAYTLWFS